MMLWKSVQVLTSADDEPSSVADCQPTEAGSRRERLPEAAEAQVAPIRRVLLLTDQPLFAEGLRELFRQSEELRLAAVSYDPEELPALVEVTDADVLVVDWAPLDYEPILSAVRRAKPAIRVVFYLRSLSSEIYQQSRALEIHGLLDKKASPDEFYSALLDVVEGKVVYQTSVGQTFEPLRNVRLSPEQQHLFRMVAEGHDDQAIAAELGLTESEAGERVLALLRSAGFRERLQIATDCVTSRSQYVLHTGAIFTVPGRPGARRPA